MKNITISICTVQVVLCLAGLLPAFSQSTNKYIGQVPPQGTVKRFSPDNMQMLAVNGVWMWHGAPAFSPDLKEVFFVKYLNPVNRTEIWYSHLVNNQWTIPVPASFGNRNFIENCPIFSPGGDTLYFFSQRQDARGISQSFRQPDGSWSDPKFLVNFPGSGWNLSITKNRTIYFEGTLSPGNDDIFRSQWLNGSYSQPERLSNEINTVSNESAPFIDPKEEYLLFISNRSGGSGLHDMYVSFRNRDGSWMPSQNFGNWINSSQEDGFPRITPDGKYLFFNTAKNSSNDQGYNPYWVSASFINLMRPVETDTANRVVFYTDRDGNPEIYSMFTDGSDLKRLTTNLFSDVDPSWSNDGKHIAWINDQDGNFELYTMNADGSNSHKHTFTGRQVGTPDWSPDGTKILFTVSDDTYSEEGDIGLINADGSGMQILTRAGQGYGPAWTDNGMNIIFCSKRTGSFEIYLTEGQGDNIQQITRSGTHKINAKLSPDGTKIVYTLVSADENDTEIHVMNADGSGDIQLTEAGRQSKNPCWSSDGKQIVFQTGRFGNQEIYQMDTDGKFQINITRNNKNDFVPKLIRKSSISGIEYHSGLNSESVLKSIRPNPVDDYSTAELFLSEPGKAGMIVTDLLGKPALNLFDQYLPAGKHQIGFNASSLSSGIYLIILKTGDGVSIKKFIKR